MASGLTVANVKPSAGSNPVLTTEGANPETLKDKVGDSLERQATQSGGGIGRRGESSCNAK